MTETQTPSTEVPDTPPQDIPAEEKDKRESPEGEGEGEGEGAFNPETGEINWDCPCLGGMAHGPCGTEFREAFSCFVYSEKEPKGIDCVEMFKAMQDCFRTHPDVYGEGVCVSPTEVYSSLDVSVELSDADGEEDVKEMPQTSTQPESASEPPPGDKNETEPSSVS